MIATTWVAVLLTVINFKSAWSQVTSSGQCVIFDSKGKFSMNQFYSGTWYVIEGYPNRFYKDAVCQEWALDSDAKYVYINETVYYIKTKTVKSMLGSGTVSKKGSNNHLVLLPGIKSLPYGAHAWVTSTDYTNYAVVYICEQLKKQSRREYIYILSRVPTLRPGLHARILINNIVRSGFAVAPLAPMNQLDCPPPPF